MVPLENKEPERFTAANSTNVTIGVNVGANGTVGSPNGTIGKPMVSTLREFGILPRVPENPERFSASNGTIGATVTIGGILVPMVPLVVPMVPLVSPRLSTVI